MKLASFLLSLAAVVALADASFAQVNVTFRNSSNEPAQLVWINGNQQTVYATLQPGESHTQSTFAGHQWKFAARLHGTFATASHEGQVVELGPSQPAPIVPVFSQPQPAPIVPVFVQPQVQQPVVQPQSSGSLNEGVVNYAKSMIGVRVGNGQCTELAINALRSVGAEVKMDYTWGTEIQAGQLQPGDIIQLQSASFEFPNGSSVWSTGPHTAVVVGVKGPEIEVLEQNMAGSPVQAGFYDTRYLKAGTMKFYRPAKIGQSNLGGGFQGGGFQGGQVIQISNWPRLLPRLP